MNKAEMRGLVKVEATAEHPLQSRLSFIFTDFSPNANNAGVPRSEAANLIATGKYMPVKINFIGSGPAGHAYAQPVGPIINMEERDNKLVAEAILWREEFPDVTEYLEKASAEEGGVQFSWELFYKGSATDESGIEWYTDCVVGAATIVDNPAYRGRTPLLSMAEDMSKDTMKVLEERLALVEERLARMDGSQDEGTNSEGTQAPVIPADILAELETLRTFQTTTLAAQAREKLLAERTASLKDLMAQADIDKRVDFICSLDETGFTAFLDSLTAVRGSKVEAERKDDKLGAGQIPEPLGGGSSDALSTKDLAAAFLKELQNS